jgi:signal transduction histidine kinase
VRQPARSVQLAQDLGLAVALFAAEALLRLVGPAQLWPSSWPGALLWEATGIAAVVVRRRWLWVAVCWTAAHTLVSTFQVHPVDSTTVAIVVVTYTAAAHLSVRMALVATALMWLPGLGVATARGNLSVPSVEVPPAYIITFNLMVALVCFLVGRTVATRRKYVAALEDRARTADTTQQALTAQAVADERRRIARELHDVVAHHVSVMGVLATGSRRMLARDPAAADEALATIEETGRTALREMRRLLSVLRTDAEPAGELEPQPGLAGVEALVEQVSEAGLPTSLRVDGFRTPLDPGVALTVYRIVQEALTNALKHAGAAATAEVRLYLGRAELVVEVTDTGRGPQLGAVAVGHGLLGMRERVMLYGGKLRTGPRPGGGFRVFARIPLDGAERPAGAGEPEDQANVVVAP